MPVKPSVSRIHLTVEAVLVSLIGGAMHVALISRTKPPFSGRWSLPGGRIRPDVDEDALAAIRRALQKKVGVEVRGLREFGTFSGTQRDPRGWALSIAYVGLVPMEATGARSAAEIRWAHIDKLPAMPCDHALIITKAIGDLRTACAQSTMPLLLMPARFTMTELQSVYESVLGGTIDRRNFRRWFTEFDAIEPLALRTKGGAQRPAELYRVKPSALVSPHSAERFLRARAG